MKLTARQRAAILRAESTFDGWERIHHCHGRTANALRSKGLAHGPELYLTDDGKAQLRALIDGQA